MTTPAYQHADHAQQQWVTGADAGPDRSIASRDGSPRAAVTVTPPDGNGHSRHDAGRANASSRELSAARPVQLKATPPKIRPTFIPGLAPFPHPPLQRRQTSKMTAKVKAKKYRQLSSAPSTPSDPRDVWIDVVEDDAPTVPQVRVSPAQPARPINIVQPSPVRDQPLALNGEASGKQAIPASRDAPPSHRTPQLDSGAFPSAPPASAPPKIPLAHDMTNLKPATLASAMRLQQVQGGSVTNGARDRDPLSTNGTRGSTSLVLPEQDGVHKKLSSPVLTSGEPSSATSSNGAKSSPGRRASSGAVFDADRMNRDLEMFRARHRANRQAAPSATAAGEEKRRPSVNATAGKADEQPLLSPQPPSASSDKTSLPPKDQAKTSARSKAAHNESKTTQAQPPPPMAPFSLWEYLKEEVLATDFDSTQEMKWERVTNFVAVPWWVESIILFGLVICLDSFLYTFTILPLRFFMAIYLWISSNISAILNPSAPRGRLHSSHKCDILKSALVVCSCYILSKLTDASKMYHSVRGQDVIKLYVIFNVMEILDRLCCSLGQDLLDALFSRLTLGRRKDGSQPLARPIAFFVMALIYIQLHTMVLFYQLVTLNVAINSYDNALLTLLMSNQFVEIKGAVFKKFEKENLFQMTCADIVERFQLALILTAIGVRNLIEVSGGMGATSGEVPLPRSFTFLPSISLIETSFAPVAIVLVSECLVDWLKHAFITKFNHIRPAVYGRFMDVLCRDLVVGGPALASVGAGGQAQAQQTQANLNPTSAATSSADQTSTSANTTSATSANTASAALAAAASARLKRRHTYVDQSPIVSRRLGFAALPLACLLVRVSAQIWGMIADTSHYDECAPLSNPTSRGAFSTADSFSFWTFLTSMGSQTDSTIDGLIQFLAWSLTLLLGWAFLVAVKLLLGTFLISFASNRYRTMTAREAEEELNARDRVPIGVDKGEREYEAKGKQYLEQQDGEGATHPPPPVKKPTGSNLMDVGRYTMIKSRLW